MHTRQRLNNRSGYDQSSILDPGPGWGGLSAEYWETNISPVQCDINYWRQTNKQTNKAKLWWTTFLVHLLYVHNFDCHLYYSVQYSEPNHINRGINALETSSCIVSNAFFEGKPIKNKLCTYGAVQKNGQLSSWMFLPFCYFFQKPGMTSRRVDPERRWHLAASQYRNWGLHPKV